MHPPISEPSDVPNKEQLPVTSIYVLVIQPLGAISLEQSIDEIHMPANHNIEIRQRVSLPGHTRRNFAQLKIGISNITVTPTVKPQSKALPPNPPSAGSSITYTNSKRSTKAIAIPIIVISSRNTIFLQLKNILKKSLILIFEVFILFSDFVLSGMQRAVKKTERPANIAYSKKLQSKFPKFQVTHPIMTEPPPQLIASHSLYLPQSALCFLPNRSKQYASRIPPAVNKEEIHVMRTISAYVQERQGTPNRQSELTPRILLKSVIVFRHLNLSATQPHKSPAVSLIKGITASKSPIYSGLSPFVTQQTVENLPNVDPEIPDRKQRKPIILSAAQLVSSSIESALFCASCGSFILMTYESCDKSNFISYSSIWERIKLLFFFYVFPI